ncbi:hypothetical protein FKM82_021003 [Ascaphus truei]
MTAPPDWLHYPAAQWRKLPSPLAASLLREVLRPPQANQVTMFREIIPIHVYVYTCRALPLILYWTELPKLQDSPVQYWTPGNPTESVRTSPK